MSDKVNRVVCHFSCGAASAVATKLAIAEYGHTNLIIYNAYLKEEHEDNRRFLHDCEKWFNHEVTIIQNEQYHASVREVWKARKYIKGMYGAPCSKFLKRDLLREYYLPNDIHIIGYTADEEKRLDGFLDANNDIQARALLVERKLTKQDCLAIIDRVPIQLPYMYRIGYDNANCIGCCKGGQNYWKKIRKDFPNDFEEVAQIQDVVGAGSHFLQWRSGDKKGTRMSLRELPEGDGNLKDEPSFDCSFFCELVEKDLQD